MNGMACVHDDTNWRAAADVVELCDSVIFGKQATAPHNRSGGESFRHAGGFSAVGKEAVRL
jgi:hypothetical protein